MFIAATIVNVAYAQPYWALTVTNLAGGFNSPYAVAVDNAGNIYVADTGNNAIKRITPDGSVATFATGFNHPQGVAVDTSGNVYVADAYNNAVEKITPGGDVSTLATSFNIPEGVAVDASGNVYVADTGSDTIKEVATNGTVSILAGASGSPGSANGAGSIARFDDPGSIAVDSSGNLYVADTGNYTIREITLSGSIWTVSTLAGLAGSLGSTDGSGSNARFNSPGGVAVDLSGNIYVADTGNHTVRKIIGGTVSTMAGQAGSSGSANGTGSSARFDNPGGVAVDNSGNVYVADTSNNCMREIIPVSATWAFITFAGLAGNYGSKDGSGTNAEFGDLYGITADGYGNIYVADNTFDTIRKISPIGIVSTLAGKAGHSGSSDNVGTNALFNGPSSVAVDQAGDLYVADTYNNTIREILPNESVSTLAGKAGNQGSADGTGSNARFADPQSLAVDSSGNVYVADTGNDTIRLVTQGGVVTTIAGRAGYNGSTDGTGTNALFSGPYGIAVDGAGDVYVADTGNDTIRKLTLNGGVWTTTTFAGQAHSGGIVDGIGNNARFALPRAIVVDSLGNIYLADQETIRVVTPAGVVSTVAGMNGVLGSADGKGGNARFDNPYGVTIDLAGNLYVADTYNYTIRKGIYAAPIYTTPFATVYSFTPGGLDGQDPVGGLIQGAYGNLYGTARYGGTNDDGSVFLVTPSGTFTRLFSFLNNMAAYPVAPLTQGRDGNLYGTTPYGGANGLGAVFKIAMCSGILTDLYSFSNNTDGLRPTGPIMQASDGNFYGTTFGGGSEDAIWGSIFRLTQAGQHTTLYSFNGQPDGAYPVSALIQGTDGNIYGTTSFGGTNNRGMVFKMTLNGSLNDLYSFSSGSDGSTPFSGVLQGMDGNLYGITEAGGTYGDGTIFKMTTNGILIWSTAFNGTNGTPSPSGVSLPGPSLIQATDGNLYGTTYGGGTNGQGTVFQITTNGLLTTLYSFQAGGFPEGQEPWGSVVQGRDGNLYGTTYNSTIFRLSIPFAFQTALQTNGTIAFGWNSTGNAAAGQVFQLQVKTNLISSHWLNVGGFITASNSTVNASDTIGTNPQRFYRLMLMPQAW